MGYEVTVVCFHGWPAANVSWQQFLQDLKEPVFLFPNTLPLQREGSEKFLVEAHPVCVPVWSEAEQLLIKEQISLAAIQSRCELRGRGWCSLKVLTLQQGHGS